MAILFLEQKVVYFLPMNWSDKPEESVMQTVKEPWICCYILLLSVGKLRERHMTSVRLHMVLAVTLHMTPAQHSFWHPTFLLKHFRYAALVTHFEHISSYPFYVFFYLLFVSSAIAPPNIISVSALLALIVTYGVMSSFSHTVWVKFGFSFEESVRCRA